MCLEINQSYPGKVLSAPGLCWQVALKKTVVLTELLTDIGLLLIVEKELEVEYVTLSIDLQKLIRNT